MEALLLDKIASSRIRSVNQVVSLLVKARERCRPCQVYLSALLIFAASRLVVVIGVKFGTLLVLENKPRALDSWDAGKAWYHRLLRFDSAWYADILSHGYRHSDGPTAFYPLYPLVSRAVKSLLGIDQWSALLLVANISALIAVLLMTKFVKDELGDEIALLSLAFFCFFPSSLFLSAGYAESLCLVFIIFSFILLTRQKFVLAAAVAGLSLGTRSTGIVMLPVILWEMWRQHSLPWPRLLPRLVLCGVLAASGLLVYMVYLEIKFGQPLAFATSQQHWASGSILERFASAVTLSPFLNLNWREGGWFLCFLALTVWSFRRLQPSASLFALGTLMLPYLTLGFTLSMNRFLLMCFPAFMCLGVLCKGRLWLTSVVIGIFAPLLLLNTALFSRWYLVG
jgi:hypothetical protein